MVFVMLSDERLLTRAILLEQFESDVNVKMAMKRVTDELGPKRINKRTAKKWYKRFRKGEMDLTVDPISWFEQVKSLGKVHAEIFAVDDLALLNNGTLLVSNRALVYRFADYDWLCKIHDNEERFLIYYNDDKTFVLDPFHGIKKIVEFDWSSIGSRMVEQIRFYLESLYFLETNKVVGTVHLFKGQTWLFVGTFDLSSCVLKFDKRINLGNLRRNVVFLNSKSILWHRFGSDSTFFSKIEMFGFSLFHTIELPFTFRFPTLRNGKLYGFRNDYPVDTRTLIEFNLADESILMHEIEEQDQLQGELNKDSYYLWIGDKLLVAQYNAQDRPSTIVQFDSTDLTWQRTKMEVKGHVRGITIAGNTLTVHARNRKHMNEFVRLHYQFQFGAVESLGNLVWKSIRRFCLLNPQFHCYFTNKVPTNSKIRSLW